MTEAKHIIHECNPSYTILNEEKDDFGVGWEPLHANGSNYKKEYKYHSAEELDGHPHWAVSVETVCRKSVVMIVERQCGMQ